MNKEKATQLFELLKENKGWLEIVDTDKQTYKSIKSVCMVEYEEKDTFGLQILTD